MWRECLLQATACVFYFKHIFSHIWKIPSVVGKHRHQRRNNSCGREKKHDIAELSPLTVNTVSIVFLRNALLPAYLKVCTSMTQFSVVPVLFPKASVIQSQYVLKQNKAPIPGSLGTLHDLMIPPQFTEGSMSYSWLTLLPFNCYILESDCWEVNMPLFHTRIIVSSEMYYSDFIKVNSEHCPADQAAPPSLSIQ